jgi:DNA-binding IclR family transcriptional regulator
MISQIGRRSPSYCTASGIVLLAHQMEIEGGLTRFSSKTIINPDKLREQLAEVRKNGYAIPIPSTKKVSIPLEFLFISIVES